MRRILISSILLIIFIWLIWSFSGRSYPLKEPELYLDLVEEINPSDTLNRNIVGIQPYMEASDYLDQETFYRKLELYLHESRKSGLIRPNTIVLLPEYLGTWLVLSGEKHNLAEKETVEEAMTTLILSNIVDFSINLIRSNEEDKVTAAIFRMKSLEMAEDYFDTFSKLSKDFNCFIAAGSIVLPKPQVVEGELIIDSSEPLYNSSFIFGPDGKIIGKPILKAFPIDAELPFVQSQTVEELPVFELPMGKAALLICADSWYPEPYTKAEKEKAEIILVPSYLTGENTMENPWQGYNGSEAPAETDLSDIQKITEWEAWNKYALPGKITKTSAEVGMNVFLRGKLWEMGADGQPLAILKGQALKPTAAARAGIWSLNY
ncbi:nitrilase-related carbon-nitrogen hydrolase [Algoriphagus formosus]|uniref:Carbon-nitrogen hydrolase n=1 Tax=Algoriphagus formosus TaxID=2007308 RepID=A0A4R5URQ9_9BACT|nr:nitrilase-related carbon-nitrogen hydrolase [Algoriphagus aquimaris]TDK41770.1 carbon-nitrogen hydrolase [Algoriphagus aquimaris]